MSRRAPLCLAVLALAAALAGCGTGAALQTQAPRELDTAAVIWACGQQAVVAPRTLTIGCADGNTILTDLRWRDWGAETATARGRISYNRCIPDCAAGRFASAPIDVRVSGLVIGDHDAAYGTVEMIGSVVVPHHLVYPLETSGPGGRS